MVNQPPPYNTPPPVMVQGRPANPPRSGRGWMLVSIVLALLLVLLVVDGAFRNLFGLDFSSNSVSGNLEELLVEDNRSPNKIVIVEVSGLISSQEWSGSGRSMVDLIASQLKAAKRDPDVRAVILKVDSPGGEVMASDDIARMVGEVQDAEEGGIPVVVSMGGVAASGGYYVSAPARWIVANEMTITGSIGVIMHSFNYRRLMDKVGLYPQVFKSGKLKDMLSGSKHPEEVGAEEKRIIQDMVDSTYERFTTVIREGRAAAWRDNHGDGRELVEDWMDYADGRVITGAQAYEYGLVDETGTFETAVERAQMLAQIPDANLIEYHEPARLFSFMNLLGEGRTQRYSLKLDLGIDFPRLETGRLYFLSSTVLH